METLASLLTRMHDSQDRLPQMGERSVAIVADWNLDRFANGLVEALEAGAPRAERSLSPDVRLLFALLRRTASPESFHRVPS